MHERFEHLYNIDRLRLDDVWLRLEEEFCICIDQIQRRLKDYREMLDEEMRKQQEINFKDHA